MTPRDRCWAPPPAALVLGGDEVHVWRVDVRSAYARRNDLWRVLARDEQQKATDLRFEGDRKRFVLPAGLRVRAVLCRACCALDSPSLSNSLPINFNP